MNETLKSGSSLSPQEEPGSLLPAGIFSLVLFVSLVLPNLVFSGFRQG